jgi:hypothetical protein
MRSRISAIGRKEKNAQKRTFSIGKRPFLPFYSDFTKVDFLILQPAFMMATVARKKIHEKTKGSILNEKVFYSCTDCRHSAEYADRLRQQGQCL